MGGIPAQRGAARTSPTLWRCGAITILTAVLLVMFMPLLALSIDAGHMHAMQTQMDRSVDAAAQAGASVLIDGRSAAEDQVVEYLVRNPLGPQPVNVEVGIATLKDDWLTKFRDELDLTISARSTTSWVSRVKSGSWYLRPNGKRYIGFALHRARCVTETRFDPPPQRSDGPMSKDAAPATTSATTPHESSVVPAHYLFPFILVTTLFALWGFANDITNPLVRAFKEIFLISNAQSSLVQWAFYGGYATMAIPAALMIRFVSYKSGIIVGLLLYAVGALLTIPASMFMQFNIFLVGFYVLTFGLAFLETTANPYILSMGSMQTATRRLNLAQAFNPIGSLTGMLVASTLILPALDVAKFREAEKERHPEYRNLLPSEVDGLITKSLEEFAEREPQRHREMVAHDLRVVRTPYVVIACVVLTVMLIFLVSKMPDTGKEHEHVKLAVLFRHLFFNFHYVGGVIAQTFYVGAQIMCWTFIIHYGMTLIGMSAAEAQNWNIAAMSIFLGSRFVCTFILKYLNPGLLLGILALGGLGFTLGAIFVQGLPGMACLVAVSACMSLMFPTIYGIALEGLSPNDAKLGSAGLIFAIVGGAFMPRIQGAMIDGPGTTLFGQTLESVRVSFFLPVLCFVIVALYGFLTNVLVRKERLAAP